MRAAARLGAAPRPVASLPIFHAGVFWSITVVTRPSRARTFEGVGRPPVIWATSTSQPFSDRLVSSAPFSRLQPVYLKSGIRQPLAIGGRRRRGRTRLGSRYYSSSGYRWCAGRYRALVAVENVVTIAPKSDGRSPVLSIDAAQQPSGLELAVMRTGDLRLRPRPTLDASDPPDFRVACRSARSDNVPPSCRFRWRCQGQINSINRRAGFPIAQRSSACASAAETISPERITAAAGDM